MDQPISDLSVFSQRTREEQWLAESRYIAINVSTAIFRSRRFAEISRHLSANTLVFEVEWRGRGTTLRDLRKDFFAMYGGFAERTQFIELVEGSTGVTVNIVCGDDAHGHSLVMHLVGQQVTRVLQETREAMRST